MEFVGEHLLIGQIGHLFVLISFIASLLSFIGYFQTQRKINSLEATSWGKFSDVLFSLQTLSVFVVFACIFYLCANHYIEYFFAYKHTSKELAFKYLLACIWEDQSGSFLLWSIWNSLIGIFIIFWGRKSANNSWKAPILAVNSLVQVFLAMMIMGVYLGSIKIGNSPFVLTRNEINGPIFQRPEYLSLIKDGVGLNVLLRNYWMVIHPPILFLGFASTLTPFAFAIAGLWTKRFAEWVKPAMPFALFSAAVLGVGIMMGGKWAYESLSFGGYWAWDPVENASLVPWLVLVAGIHTMLIFNATGHSLRASYLFAILTFIFILYSTFLTRTGILGDTSVHAFTEAGKAMNYLILCFLLFFTIGGLGILTFHLKKIPAIAKEEDINSREFWMFIGSLVFFMSAIFISAKTSLPVINSLFGTKLAPPENVEFSYNKVMILISIIIGILSAIVQYMRYKATPSGEIFKKILIPTIIAIVATGILCFLYPINYQKEGPGFLAAIYVALFATIYSVVANAFYIWKALHGKLKFAGGSVAHLGFALMIAGMLISAGNKKIISEEKYKAFSLPVSIDPLTKQQDNPAENINLIRQVPARMGPYKVTYLRDSVGSEKDRRFYHLLFENNDSAQKESFVLSPDVYIMKNNSMSSNPDIRNYLTHDVFTYISYALNPEKNKDTASFVVSEMKPGDTAFYSKGLVILDSIKKNPTSNKFNLPINGPSVLAYLRIKGADSMQYVATPMITVDSFGIHQYDDTVYAQNLFVQFAGVSEDQQRIKVGIKESDKMIDFVTLKAYIFPYINLVWIGLILMAIGIVMSLTNRIKISQQWRMFWLISIGLFLIYMFLFAN